MPNIKAILDLIKSILLNSYTANLPLAKTVINKYIVDAESRFVTLTTGAVSGQLSYKEVVQFLKDEAVNLEDDLISVGEIVGSDLQQLIASALGIFEGILKASIPVGK